MSITSQSTFADSEGQRRAVFMDSLSDGSILGAVGDRRGVVALLGLRPISGQPPDLVTQVKSGLPLSAGESVAAHLGIQSKDFLIRYVGMSESTVRRRYKSNGPLSPRESDRVVRYAHLLCLAMHLHSGSEKAVREWLSAPCHPLGGSTPLEMAITETGARRVEDLIVALEQGLFV